MHKIDLNLKIQGNCTRQAAEKLTVKTQNPNVTTSMEMITIS